MVCGLIVLIFLDVITVHEPKRKNHDMLETHLAINILHTFRDPKDFDTTVGTSTTTLHRKINSKINLVETLGR